jgi:hypothetical protein
MGLEEGRHFAVKMPECRDGYFSILREGLAYAAWHSIHGSSEQQRLAARFVEYILQRAREEGDAVFYRCGLLRPAAGALLPRLGERWVFRDAAAQRRAPASLPLLLLVHLTWLMRLFHGL